MTDTSSRVSLDHGSSAEIATTAKVTHVSGRGEGLVEDNNAVLPISTKTDTIPPPKSPRSRLTRLDNTPKASIDRARAINNDENIQPPSPELNSCESNLAHQAALRRLNGVSSNHRRVREAIETSPSSSGIEPVLVRSYSNSTPLANSSQKAKMRNNRRSRVDEKSCELPRLDRFSFQDILASIDSDVKGSIDAIAEICGRSRMSLADQYGSHLPPQGVLTSLLEHGDAQGSQPGYRLSQQESSPGSQLTRNQTQDQDRRNSASLGLVGNLHPRRSATLSAPIVATSNINSQSLPSSSTYEHAGAITASADPQSTLLPHVLSWLRRSSASFAAGAHEGTQPTDGDHDSAAEALQRILRRREEPPPPSSVN